MTAGAVSAVVLAGAQAASAHEASSSKALPENLLTRQFTLIGGGFFSFNDTEFQINNKGSDRSGTEVSLEDDLGLEKFTPAPFGEARWRITPRHRVELGYAAINRDATDTTDRLLIIDNLVIPPGAATDTKVDFELGRITYGYSFINDGKKEIGAMVGVHIAHLDYDVTASGLIGGQVREESTGDDFTGPMPHVGVMGGYAFRDDLVLSGRVVGFYLEIDDYTGWLLEAETSLTYMIWQNFGLGIGARYLKLDLEADTSSFDGDFDFQFVGPTAFAVLTF